MIIYVERQPDGSWIDWGRHGPARGVHGARYYSGEDAKILDKLLLKEADENGK